MNQDSTSRLERLFRRALELPRQERSAFLDESCRDDPALRDELEGLLRADDEAEEASFLERGAGEWVAELFGDDVDLQPDLKGRQIGPYTIMRLLGEGGMGNVYLAERSEPFERKVALKILRHGPPSRDTYVRFALERQILASLSHPNIARLYDGGVTGDGMPYLAMELVEGQPITEFCDEHRLPIRERLQLFRSACDAVHYAHQNLIIHRDIKPSNVHVTNDGTVKLLDFGIAKLLNPEWNSSRLPVTRAGQQILTPEYASPEQLANRTLTTGSDIYSLGVILYELLTGRRPHHLSGRSLAEFSSVVNGSEAVRPSTRLSLMRMPGHPNRSERVPDLGHISAVRGTSPLRLHRQLHGDLDTITLMALRKEPGRRYSSAKQLSQDLERHLSGRPVNAVPSTLRYRSRKFVARHWRGVLSAALIVLSLAAGLAGTLLQARETRLERDRTRIEAQRAQATADFLIDLFRAPDPAVARGDTVTAHQLLSAGARQVEHELDDQPGLQSDMLVTLSEVYHHLGNFEEALRMANAALTVREQLYSPDHPRIAEVQLLLGQLHRNRGSIDRSVDALRKSLAIYRSHREPGAPDVVIALNALAATLRYKGMLGDMPAYGEAERLHREALAAEESRDSPDPIRRAESLKGLAYIARDKGRYGEAETRFRRLLTLQRASLTDDHPAVINTTINIAAVLADQGRFEESIALYRQGLDGRRAIQGSSHVDYAIDLGGLGEVYLKKGDYAAAEQHLREALRSLREALPADNLRITKLMRDLSHALTMQGQTTEAQDILQQLLTTDAEGESSDYWTAVTQRLLAEALAADRKYSRAEELLRESYASLRRSYPGDRETTNARESLIALYDQWNKPGEANRYREVRDDE